MSNLRNIAKNLPQSMDFIRMQSEFSFDLKEIRYAAIKLAEKYDSVGKMPTAIDLKQLLAKITAGNTDLNGRERRNIPFLLFMSECTDKTFYYLLTVKELLNWKRQDVLSRIFYVYFANYTNNQYGRSEKLRRKIEQFLATKPLIRRKSLVKMIENKGILFSPNNLLSMSGQYRTANSVLEVVGRLGLYKSLDNCKFIIESIKLFFGRLQDLELGLRYYKYFTKNKEKYEAVLPALCSSIIPLIDAAPNNDLKKEYKKECLDFFYTTFKDPRFGGRNIKWDEVDNRAREIFIKWISENDLKLFFQIIGFTAVDSMWKRREEFWNHYLPHISNTWVFLGRDARDIAQELSGETLLGYGDLLGGTKDQSVFAFQIKDYVFVEWSHNGKLRVWHKQDVPKLFGCKSIARTDITGSSTALANFVHYKTLWENTVGKWLYDYCKI